MSFRHVMPRCRESLAVAHIVLTLDMGGLERLVVDLAHEGQQLGQETVIVCLERPGFINPRVEARGARIECVGKEPGMRPSVVARLRKLFLGLRPDIVHTHQIGALLYAGIAARGAKVPVVLHTEHGKHYSQRLRTRWLGRMAGRYADKFCCVSSDIAGDVRRFRVVPNAKIEVVANGVDVGRFAGGQSFERSPRLRPEDVRPTDESPKPKTKRQEAPSLREELGIPPEGLVIGTIGRLSEVKRQDLLIRAFAKMAEGQPKSYLVIVGEGALRRDLERLAASVAPVGRVYFVGCQADPERWLSIMDIFALTSRSEGMPVSILEAWAAGVPVVSSAVGGVPELISDGATGLLFDSGDQAALVRCWQQLLSDRALGERIVRAGRERVGRDYSLSSTAEKYQRLYGELLERQTSPPKYLSESIRS